MLNEEVKCGASVVICCHNSEKRLRPTLEHLANQQVQFAWEVIVVDNGSTDDTAILAHQIWQEVGSPAPFRVVGEKRLGLSFARERGISEAKFEYVILCDDDNWLDARYIRQAVEIMDARPDIGALGGDSHPKSDVTFPAWFWSCAQGYAVGAQALESGDITSRRLVWGAGMVLRRNAYREILSSGMRTRLKDRSGAELSTGGDGEICKWLILAGYRLWYDDRLKLTHFISPERLTKDYCRRLRDGSAEAGRLMKPYHIVINSENMTRAIPRFKQLLFGIARSLIGDRTGRYAIQAFSPFPSLVVDQTTRQIQLTVKRIRCATSPPTQPAVSHVDSDTCNRKECLGRSKVASERVMSEGQPAGDLDLTDVMHAGQQRQPLSGVARRITE